jgi:O-antigen/teichoic acid export membrane protein
MYIFTPGIAIARKTRWQLFLTSLSAVLAVGLNLWLIPLWGALGAAVASCVTSAVFLVLWIAAGQRVYALPFRWRALATAIAVYVVMVCLVLWASRLHWPVEASVTLKFLVVGSLAAILNWLGLFQWRELTGLRSEQMFNDPTVPSASRGAERE